MSDFAADLRGVAADTDDDREAIRRVVPLARRLVASRDAWLTDAHRACGADGGIGVHVLHEEANHDLAVFAVAWPPGYETPAHDHGTWAVVVGIEGAERNVNWRRLDDGARPGYAEIEPAREIAVGLGDVANFMPRDIHSVHNDGDGVTVSLHVYGRHVNHTERWSFDPATNSMEPFRIPVTG